MALERKQRPVRKGYSFPPDLATYIEIEASKLGTQQENALVVAILTAWMEADEAGKKGD